MPSGWIKKRKSDYFYKKAKEEKYSSRAAYKLLEFKKFGIFSKKTKIILDLCSHPGSWIEVLLKEIPTLEMIIAIDIKNLKISNNPKIKFIKGNITNEEIQIEIKNLLGNKFFDLIISDCSPKLSGDKYLDHNKQLSLAMKSLEFTQLFLKNGGNIVVKYFQGKNEDELINKVKEIFFKAKTIKPKASLKKSPEMYVIGLGKK
ncbi:MAG: SAM-dependent methyltransferase [Candidatus Helarchaeota archaeon]